MNEGAPRIRIKIAPLNLARARRWGDWFFALSLAEALRGFGHDAAVETRDLWDHDSREGDVALVLRGFGGYRPRPGLVSLMWIISHPGNVQPEELEPYHHVFTASVKHKRKLRKQIGERVSTLFQAHDPAIMNPDVEPIPSGLLYVGNNRRGGRPALDLATTAGFDVSLWGSGWAGHPVHARFLKGAFIPNAELGRHYAGARAVLNDTWRDMRLAGFPSNRIFDVLAAGAPLVSDAVPGTPEDLLPWIHAWERAEDFPAAVEAALAEGEERRAARRAFAKDVNARHSFRARAAEISARARELVG